jgi:hypothetical protein
MESVCETCALAKHTHISFSKSTETRAAKPFERVHMDLLEMPVRSIDDDKYALIITDDLSRFRFVSLLKTKGETADKIKAFVATAPALSAVAESDSIKNIRHDNGTEFVNRTSTERRGFNRKRQPLTRPSKMGLRRGATGLWWRWSGVRSRRLVCLLASGAMPSSGQFTSATGPLLGR